MMLPVSLAGAGGVMPALRVGIIGCGPRGLAAAEHAFASLPGCRIDIFDPSPWPAAGPNFALDEAACCRLNLRASDVDIPTPVLSDHPSFSDWVCQTTAQAVDQYPPRHLLGEYLHSRFCALDVLFPGALTHHQQAVTKAWRDASGWWLATHIGEYGPYDELVLAMGQPLTQPDPTWQRWRAQAAGYGVSLASAYPGHVLQRKAADWAEKTVAIRGLGLAALDVLAVLTLGQGGRFSRGRYIRSGREPAVILPFSLDGMPPLPKPVQALESRFTLTGDETALLGAALAAALDLGPEDALAGVTHALAEPAKRMSGEDPTGWLRVERDKAGAQDSERPPLAVLRDGIDMAAGRKPASVGYCIGQIWRKFQPELRRIFLASDGPAETRAAILGFDRGLKRMTYGPPLSSAELMLALADDGLVRLAVADDPKIKLTAQGWVLNKHTHAQVMIDAVLPPPRLDVIDDPLIRAFMSEGFLREDEATGGVDVDDAGRAAEGLAVLGRLTEGRSIAADSIHDCFGVMTRNWARGIARATKPVHASGGPDA